MIEEVNSSMIYLIYCKNFWKCHNVPPLSTTIKKKKKEQGPGYKPQYYQKPNSQIIL
jgi:hypothetical protein